MPAGSGCRSLKRSSKLSRSRFIKNTKGPAGQLASISQIGLTVRSILASLVHKHINHFPYADQIMLFTELRHREHERCPAARSVLVAHPDTAPEERPPINAVQRRLTVGFS
jgi:hypothetical protein